MYLEVEADLPLQLVTAQTLSPALSLLTNRTLLCTAAVCVDVIFFVLFSCF